MDGDRVERGRIGTAWLLVLIAAVAACGVLIVKSSRPARQLQIQTTAPAQPPVRPSPAAELVQAVPSRTAAQPQQGSQNTSHQTTCRVLVEVIHFHGTHQCYSCKMVGALAEKTVHTDFQDELASGRITFAHVNGQLAENRELVRKYGARSASLWIGTTMDGTFHKEQVYEVWRKIRNERDYLEYLKGLLERRLAGDLS